MAITYKKAGVDISEIKKSQKAIGRLIASTHKLQNNEISSRLTVDASGVWSRIANP